MKKLKNSIVIVIIACTYLSCKKESPVKEIPDNALAKNQLKEINACSSPPQIWGIRTAGGQWGDSGMEIVLSPSGIVALAGSYAGTVDFDPGAGITNLTGGGYFSQWFDGNARFVRAQKQTQEDFLPRDKQGNIYHITAEEVPGSEFDDWCLAYANNFILVKKSPSGDTIWKRIFAKNVYNTCNLTPAIYKTDNNDNIVINFEGGWSKFTSSGDNISFTAQHPNTGRGSFWLDKQGNIYFRHSNYGPTPDNGISKYDGKTGKKLWYREGDFATVDIDNIDNVFLTGTFEGTRDFNPGSGTYNLTTASPNTMFIQKLDANGSFHWAKKLGVGNPRAVKVNPNGKYIYVAGSFAGTQTYTTITGNVKSISKGATDAFIMLLRQCN